MYAAMKDEIGLFWDDPPENGSLRRGMHRLRFRAFPAVDMNGKHDRIGETAFQNFGNRYPRMEWGLPHPTPRAALMDKRYTNRHPERHPKDVPILESYINQDRHAHRRVHSASHLQFFRIPGDYQPRSYWAPREDSMMLYLSEEMCESDHKNSSSNIIVNHSNSSPSNHRSSDNFNHNSNTSTSSSISSSSHSDSNNSKNDRHAKKEQKRRPKPKDGTKLICRVCNDVALGYNFDAITCESCKAFFRRNALKKKVFNCTFEGKCRLDPHTRKFCASCRLKRCFEIGMKKGWILNDEQLAKRRQRLSQANEKKLKSPQSLALSPSGSYSNQSNHSSTSSTSTTSAGIFSDTEKEMTVSSQPIVEEYKQITMPVDKYPLLSDIYWNLLNSKKDVRFTLYPIRQLVQHHEEIFSGSCKIEENIEPNIPYDSIECMYKSITLVISFMKTIPDFQKLAHEDRIAIFMGSIREVFAIRAAISYSFKGGFVVFRNQKGQDKYLDPVILKNALGEKLFTQIADFIKSFKICTNEDKVIMILLMLIEFFNPEKSEVSNVLLVKKAQEKFTYWLRCYIEAKYPEMIAKLLYQKVLLKLNDVREIGNICNEASKTFLWKDFDPLIAEVLDMK